MIRDEFIDFDDWNSSFGIMLKASGKGSLSNEKSSAKQRTIIVTAVVSYINFLPGYAVILVHGLFLIIIIIITV